MGSLPRPGTETSVNGALDTLQARFRPDDAAERYSRGPDTQWYPLTRLRRARTGTAGIRNRLDRLAYESGAGSISLQYVHVRGSSEILTGQGASQPFRRGFVRVVLHECGVSSPKKQLHGKLATV